MTLWPLACGGHLMLSEKCAVNRTTCMMWIPNPGFDHGFPHYVVNIVVNIMVHRYGQSYGQ